MILYCQGNLELTAYAFNNGNGVLSADNLTIERANVFSSNLVPSTPAALINFLFGNQAVIILKWLVMLQY